MTMSHFQFVIYLNYLAPPMSCTKDDDCHADKGKCVAGMCYCDGFYVGNGVQCRGENWIESLRAEMLASIDLGNKMLTCLRSFAFITDAKRCPKDVKCGAHSTCMVDPLFPKTPTCKCDAGYRKNMNGKCVGELIKEKNKREKGNMQLGNPIRGPSPHSIPDHTYTAHCPNFAPHFTWIKYGLLGTVSCQSERV